MNAIDFRRVRMELQMTQEEFAGLLGLSGKKAVSHIETGIRNPSKLTKTFLTVLDNLPKRKAEELVELMLKHGKEI